MAMTCKICGHSNRAAIDKAIIENSSLRDIASHYGMSRSAVDRHKKHIPKALAKARQAQEICESTSFLSRVEKWVYRCERLFDRAEEAGEWTAAASAAREIRGTIELLAKLNGELQSGGAKIAISVAQIANLNVRDLSREQATALYERVQAEQLRKVQMMSDQDLDNAIDRLLAERDSP